jgi:hypothetical protein
LLTFATANLAAGGNTATILACGAPKNKGGLNLLESWTGKLVGKMHVHEITYDEVAAELGVSRPYVSMLLNGHRKPPDAKKRIEMAIDSIIAKRAENG